MKKVVSVIVSLILLLSLMPAAVFAEDGEEKFTEVEFGKEYSFQPLEVEDWISWRDCNLKGDCCLKIVPPEKGRIRVWIKNFSDEVSISDNECHINEYYCTRNWIKKGDTANTGWISVDKENVFIWFGPYYDRTAVIQPTVYVEYEKSSDYNGELEPNDTFEKATPIKSGITYYGDYGKNIDDYRGEDDYYTFNIGYPSLVKIKIKNELKGSWGGDYPPDFTLYLNDENGNKIELLTEKDKPFDSELEVTSSLRLPKGQYYLLISPSFSECVEYSFSIDYSTNEASGYYEQEFNDSSSAANYIEIDQQYTGNFNTERDVDWFKFVLNEKRNINLEFRVPEQSGRDTANVTLYDEEFNVIKEIATDNNAYYSMDKVTKPAGIYYVKVAPGYNCLNSNSNYSFKINTDTILNPVTDLKVAYDKYNKLKVTWDATDGAKGYNIYSKKGKSKVLIKRGYTEDCEFLAENLADGAKYTFVVEPCASKDNELIPAEYARKEVSAYTLAKVIQNKPGKYNSSKVKITWNKVYGADGYEVQKLMKKNSKYVVMNNSRTSKTSINIKAKKKTKYYYKVRAYKSVNGDRIYAPWSSQKSYKL